MQLVVEDAWLPATLTHEPMSDEEFIEFCERYPDYFIETTADGEILIMPPSDLWTSSQIAEIAGQLREWARADGRGSVSESSGGVVLPNGARRAPDAAWISSGKLVSGKRGLQGRRWRITPEFVIELRSPGDRLSRLRAKMREWVENGVELAWLIDPERRAVEIYRPGSEPEILADAATIRGEGPVEGFELALGPIWGIA